MVSICRIKGWELNSNDKIINNIIRATERNEGECPCSSNTSEDKHCPCSNYRAGKGCCCNLYVKLLKDKNDLYDLSNSDED